MRPVFTSGPWKVEKETIVNPAGSVVATVVASTADLHLMSFSPAMRSLLIQVGRHFDEMPKRGERARALHQQVNSIINQIEKLHYDEN